MLLTLSDVRHTTPEENELLTTVEAGTPMGELLRRYWWAVGISDDLKDKPTLIRVLGEDLVLFRDGMGRPGVLGAHCSHRRVNLCFGTQEAEGLRCRMHGWVYDVDGNVLETPGEPAESSILERVHHPAYPVQELGGVIFINMGPPPVPLLPRFHFLIADGWRRIAFQGFTNCNWLQAVENGMDPIHPAFLHKDQWPWRAPTPDVMEFFETEWAIISKAHRPAALGYDETLSVHASVFPAMSMAVHEPEPTTGLPPASVRFSTPIDDTHTAQIRVMYSPVERQRRQRRAEENASEGTGAPTNANGGNGTESEATGSSNGKSTEKSWGEFQPAFGIGVRPYSEYLQPDGAHPELGYTIPVHPGIEDHTVIDSMGGKVDRQNENLLTIGDVGVVRIRRRLLEAIEAVRAGRDPQGVIHDASQYGQIIIALPR
jgi:5,5'-dehydrodivanillate O-demethylase